jgi:hypothetical protein
MPQSRESAKGGNVPLIERLRAKINTGQAKIITGQPARPVDYFMLGGMLVMIVMLGTLYLQGVRCIP